MPEHDREKLKLSFFERQVSLAFKARADNVFASEVPWEVFLNYVLPYANLDEPREDWRTDFYARFAPLVAGAADPLEAAVSLNAAIWTLGGWNISFVAGQTPEIMAPSQVIAHGYASCTGLAIFLVNACRAVGVPARVVGTAEWVGSGGNHNWLEVWHDGVWHFTEPLGPPRRPYNSTWFVPDPAGRALPGSYAHGIYAASFKRTGRAFPLAWYDEYESAVPGHEVTSYYLEAAAAQSPPSAAAGAEAEVGRRPRGPGRRRSAWRGPAPTSR
ncbi:hypothetical protein GPECTOR_262g669 [Gonium pectorale]|uniref:Transglutaminase-like domain-containing protein n=1 Tax=Gonium pectorale TaxID=33097 RepID=A0A150FW65_GONPE|nr:hypothetical protein GPECTOR_262g669 [Gonium pectorale]|eukprot:KXZ41851.1 hypothetical protein GPECTOR_262g669 [Gonium pectorale]